MQVQQFARAHAKLLSTRGQSDRYGDRPLGPLLCLPIYYAQEKLYKAYIVIYTCAATRAVILDVVHNANASTFISCFKRFISRRGCPSTVISDNGSAFISDDTQNFVSSRLINWKFNLEKAPWWGGMWERLV